MHLCASARVAKVFATLHIQVEACLCFPAQSELTLLLCKKLHCSAVSFEVCSGHKVHLLILMFPNVGRAALVFLFPFLSWSGQLQSVASHLNSIVGAFSRKEWLAAVCRACINNKHFHSDVRIIY